MQNPTQLDDLFVKKWLLFLAHNEVAAPKSPSPTSVDSLDIDTVLCAITRREIQFGSFTLSIDATVSSDLQLLHPHAKTSPIAIIDTFSANTSNTEPPEWLNWPDNVIFVYNRPEFVGIFAKIAMWNENLAKKHLSVSMIHWARAIAVGTWAASKQLGPTTPDKSSVPKNFKPHRQRWNDGVYWMHGFPTTATPMALTMARMQKSSNLVPCQCPECEGELVSVGKRQRHEARDRRALSTQTRSHVPVAATPPSSVPASDLPPPFMETVDAFIAEYITPNSASGTTTFRDTAEAEGLAHSQQVEASGEIFLPISSDDWELPDTSAGQPGEENADGPPPPPDENDPDPFYTPPKSAQPLPTARDVHPNPAVYLIYITVLWLHTAFHLPFRACSALLAIFALALKSAGAPITPPMRTTLPTVIHHLGAEPSFQILPVCPGCLEVFAASTPIDAVCPKCSHPLFPNNPTPSQMRNNTAPENPRPYLQYPIKSLAEQLAMLLAIEGIEMELEKSLGKAKGRIPGVWKNIFDGKICQELPTADGSKFFFPSDAEIAAGELRLGVTLGADWFSYLRSQIAASHTSGPMSYSLINLPEHLRYRAANILLAGIMPGPKEATPDQCQRFLRPLINELLRLWRDGVVIKTPKYPEGRLVRVALVAVICDKPAAHKLGGFGSHSHTNFCTMCWINQGMKASPEAFQENGFPERTDAEHRRLQKEYLKCTTKSARDAFVKKNATRWSELHRLPYFNICQMIVIDPMHNLFLGVVKTHFYHIWVQLNVLRKTKELRTLHALLSKLKLPAHLGRLPSLIGEPAGGSLTADQWLVFCTVVAPLIIPQLWQEYIPEESPQELAQRRAREIAATLEAKRAAAAAARQAQPETTGKRARRPTAKAAAMDIDPDDTTRLDAGANDESDDDS